jgi:hypothetical protein
MNEATANEVSPAAQHVTLTTAATVLLCCTSVQLLLAGCITDKTARREGAH